jgi:hypothetical protein
MFIRVTEKYTGQSIFINTDYIISIEAQGLPSSNEKVTRILVEGENWRLRTFSETVDEIMNLINGITPSVRE